MNNNQALNDKLKFIGFQLTGAVKLKKTDWVDIEQTLYEASLEIPRDARLLSLMCSWVLVHGDLVIVEKLMRLQKKYPSPWLVAIAIFAAQNGYHKWKRLMRRQRKQTYLIDKELAISAIALKGEESGMARFNFLVPKGSIRVREKDALSVRELALMNKQYRNRILFGAAIRADIITAIEFGMSTPSAVAKAVGCSYEPAHRIFKEYQMFLEINAS